MSTPGGLLLALAVLLPFVGMLLGLVAGGRHVRRIAFVTILVGLGIAVGITWAWLQAGELVYLLGDWSPPLGIALRADGPAVAMMLAVAFVVGGIALYARADFDTPVGSSESRAAFTYWLLLLAVWGSLNLVFVSGDLFTLYVALELLTFAGVPLVCLAGSGETLRAALRYLLFALCGSVLYLLGAVLLYGGYGTLDMRLLADVVEAEPIAWTALALMTVGLLAKTALFPLHIWLPPAHGGAPAAASAVLSALVIKGSWFLVLRLWCDVMPGVAGTSAAQLLGGAGRGGHRRRQRGRAAPAAAEAAGGLFDGGADRLPVPDVPDGADGAAASTTARWRPACCRPSRMPPPRPACSWPRGWSTRRWATTASTTWPARRVRCRLPMLAFVLGGVALMGVLPSGAYLAKKLLLDAADTSGQWWWTLVLQGGAVFTAGYVVLILVRVLRRPAQPLTELKPVSMLSQWAALGLSLASLGLALTAVMGPLPASLISNPLSPKELGNTLVVLAVGTLLALGPGAAAAVRRPRGGALRGATQALARGFEQGDHFIRRWPSAMVAMLGIAATFGWLLARA